MRCAKQERALGRHADNKVSLGSWIERKLIEIFPRSGQQRAMGRHAWKAEEVKILKKKEEVQRLLTAWAT